MLLSICGFILCAYGAAWCIAGCVRTGKTGVKAINKMFDSLDEKLKK